MSGITEVAVTVIVLAATAALPLGVFGLLRIPNTYMKVHAISATVILVPLLVLVAVLIGGGSDLILRALLVALFLIVSAAVSTHAIVRLETLRMEREE